MQLPAGATLELPRQDIPAPERYIMLRFLKARALGRWLSRDPLGEMEFEQLNANAGNPQLGGATEYGFVANDAENTVDCLGLIAFDPTGCGDKSCKDGDERKDWFVCMGSCISSGRIPGAEQPVKVCCAVCRPKGVNALSIDSQEGGLPPLCL